MQIDAARNIYISGFMGGLNDFDPGPGVYELAAGQRAPFVVKLAPCLNPTRKTLTLNACDTFIINHARYDSSGTYVQVIPNTAGCDSVITLHLTISKTFTEQTKTICEGALFFAGGADQRLPGTYHDTLSTVAGCDSIVTTHLVVTQNPLPNLSADRNLCKNNSLSVSPGSFASYKWQDNSTGPTFTIEHAGTYWVEVRNNFNCVATDTFTILNLLEPPANFLKLGDSVCSYKSLELLTSGSYLSYEWSTGAASPFIKVQTPGVYYLKVTDNNGCTGTDFTVVVAKTNCLTGVFIPTAFSPDNNGVNDKFKPLIFGTPLQYKLVVYNRFGSIVFETTNPHLGWYGTIKGIRQENSSFVWTCSYQLEGGIPRNEKGTVVLVR